MRFLFWFLLLAAAAVGVALATRLTAGYALFVAPPYRVELSLNLFLLLVVGGFAGGYALMRVIVHAMRLPDEVREFRRRQQQERARARHDAAVVALLEGRYGRARQFAEEALAIPQSSGLSALVAARAAIETRDFDVAEKLLARPDAEVPSLAVPRLMLQESFLSFLGLNVQGQEHSWGAILNEALVSSAGIDWWMILFPGGVMFLTLVSLTVLGEKLEKILGV